MSFSVLVSSLPYFAFCLIDICPEMQLVHFISVESVTVKRTDLHCDSTESCCCVLGSSRTPLCVFVRIHQNFSRTESVNSEGHWISQWGWRNWQQNEHGSQKRGRCYQCSQAKDRDARSYCAKCRNPVSDERNV
jgi:hypothetical protein